MMRLHKIILAGLFATAFFTACEKPEKLYPQPKTSLGVQSQIFAMGENYANQLWFDFATQKTETNAFGLWHMGFSCDPSQPRVSINGGISASFGVARFAGSSFGRLTADSIKKVQWYFDNPNGDPDSSAFPLAFVKNGAQWEVNDYTYVIDLGDKIKDSTRYVQLKFNDCPTISNTKTWSPMVFCANKRSR